MEHAAAVIEKRTVGNGQIQVLLRCCGDPDTDSWHTLGISHETTNDDVTAWLGTRKGEVQAQHAALQAAASHLDSLQ